MMPQYRPSLIQLLSDVLQVELPAEVDDLQRSDCAEWDSVNHFRLIMELEEQFGLVLDDEQAANLSSLGEVEELLRQKHARSSLAE